MKHAAARFGIVGLSSLLVGAGCGGRVIENLHGGSGGGSQSASSGAPGATAGTGASIGVGAGVVAVGAGGSFATPASATSTVGSTGTLSSSTGFGGAIGVGPSGTTSTSGPSGVTSTGTSGVTSTGAGGASSLGWIDNMDDGDNQIDHTDGRKGYWYTFNDKTAGGMQTPAPQAAFAMTSLSSAPIPGHAFAANTFGGGFDTWGAALGVDLNSDGITLAAYDASKFKGIRLWARVGPNADPGGRVVRFLILDGNTAAQGGVCDPNASGATGCYDGFGANLVLTTTWQQWTFQWSELTQAGWGLLEPGIAFDKIYSIQFKTGSTDAFDTWIFGLEFF